MRQFKYNAQFFDHWMNEHPEINKRDILNVLETKDYASLKRWAEGSEMPTKSIIKLCNAYGIDIENFFIGMIKPADIEQEDVSKNIDTEKSDNVFPNNDENTPLTPSKRLQLEARHSKDIFLREKQHQQVIDNIRAEYDRRIDDQRREMMQTIDNQSKQIARQSEVIAHLSGMLAGTGSHKHTAMPYGLSEPLGKGAEGL